MQINTNKGATKIRLTVRERKSLADAAELCRQLAKNLEGDGGAEAKMLQEQLEALCIVFDPKPTELKPPY